MYIKVSIFEHTTCKIVVAILAVKKKFMCFSVTQYLELLTQDLEI